MPLNNTVSIILPGVVVAVAAIVVFLADLVLERVAVGERNGLGVNVDDDRAGLRRDPGDDLLHLRPDR